MQLTLLKYREDIIKAKVAKEHMESNLRSENLFLKDRVMAEQQEKTTVEETLTQEINQLQEQLGKGRIYIVQGHASTSYRNNLIKVIFI